MTEKKSFGLALLAWVFFGGIGGHRIYVKEKMHYIAWYWILTVCTLGIIPIVDLFLIKGIVQEANNGINRTGKDVR